MLYFLGSKLVWQSMHCRRRNTVALKFPAGSQARSHSLTRSCAAFDKCSDDKKDLAKPYELKRHKSPVHGATLEVFPIVVCAPEWTPRR